MIDLKTFLKIIGMSVLFGTYITFCMVFLWAYRSTEKKTIVNIDMYGEANLELWMLITTLPLVLWVVYETWRKVVCSSDSSR